MSLKRCMALSNNRRKQSIHIIRLSLLSVKRTFSDCDAQSDYTQASLDFHVIVTNTALNRRKGSQPSLFTGSQRSVSALG